MSTKEHILELLEKNRGEKLSGAHLAKLLNVSRNSIWKAIKELEKDGYVIEAVTNAGYSLSTENDILSKQGMAPFLSKTIDADKIHVYKTVESTNKTAKELAIGDAPHATIVIADCQTDGKGRYGRSFFSPARHGLYMSFIIRPEFINLRAITMATMLAAVAVCEAIESVSKKTTQIKWVNDIILDDKKVCGILTEATTDFESGNIQWVVVGIGINVTTPCEMFPKDISAIATSIEPSCDNPINRNRLSAEISNRILLEKELHDSGMLLNKYKQRLTMIGKRIKVTAPQEVYYATAVDIDEIGRLIAQKENSDERIVLSAGEISIG